MATVNPADTPKTAQHWRIWLTGTTTHSLFRTFHDSVKSNLIEAVSEAEADLQLLDWRRGAKRVHITPETTSNLIDNSTPSLIVIDEDTDTDACINSYAPLDLCCCEFINITEIHTSILSLRLNKLTQSFAKQSSQKLLKENAEVILDAVMRYSNDWMVVKSLDHRFIFASGKFCRANEKSFEEILGKDDLQLGTPPELVYGKPESDWKGYWTLDKEVTDSGKRFSSTPLLLDEEQNLYEGMDKVPLHDVNGEVFALLVCVYRYIQNNGNTPVNKDARHRDSKSSQLWDLKPNLPNNPALFSVNKEHRRAVKLHEESDRAFIAKNRFIATASHDLRQPLHALGLYIGVLESTVTEDERDLVGKIKSCVGAMSELLTSLLDISRLDANVVAAEMDNFSIGELLLSLKSECHSVACGKSLDLTCSIDESLVYSDPVLLRRVIRNLVINAINNTLEGKITLTSRRLGNCVEIIVSDTGIGIPREHQNLVFEEFAKIESNPHEAQQGIGLGLSIVKRLCLLLKIGLRLESEVGIGTRVILSAPLGSHVNPQSTETNPDVNAGSGMLQQHHPQSPSSKGKKVLVIDDDGEVCKAVETILLHSGYQVVSATSLANALALLESSITLPDAMLVDFRLSENTTGLDAIAIVAEEFGVSIPALIVTGDTTDDGLKEITESGYQHLHKPVEVGELLRKVQETVSRTNIT